MKLRALFRRFVDWLRSFFWRDSKKGLFRVVRVTEEPDPLVADCLYLVGEGSHLSHATLLCPCGCGETIALDMLPGASPGWTFSGDDGGPSLHPSISRIRGCRSHFFLRAGRIEWCDVRSSAESKHRSISGR